jgi:hypothetical protein
VGIGLLCMAVVVAIMFAVFLSLPEALFPEGGA